MRLAWLLVGLLPSSVGCVLYVPDLSRGDTRGVIPKKDLAFISEDETTREEVILELGEPDFVAYEAGEVLVYTWWSYRGEMFIALFGNSGGTVTFPIGRKAYLFVKIDEAGKVHKHKLDSTHPTKGVGEAKPWSAMLREW
jgi:hypothetical protein